MRRPTAPGPGVGVGILTALVLAACTTPAQTAAPVEPSATTATATAPRPGSATATTSSVERPSLVVETVFDFTSLDPHTLLERSGLVVADATYETLTTLDPEDPTKVLPGLAEWTMSPERNWLTLRLRPDATFSDGSRVTSDDVVFTLARARGLGGAAAELLGPIGLTKVDDRTLTVTSPGTNFALPAVLANPALGILNADVVIAHGGAIGEEDTAASWLSWNSAGSGPYVIAEVDAGRSITLEPNPHWTGEDPVFPEVIVRNATPAQQVTDIESGAADVVLDLPPDRADAMKLRPKVSSVAITSQTSPALAFLLLNDDQSINRWTGNPDFVTAVRLGLDVEALAERAGPGAVPALGLVPRGLPGAFEPPAPAPTGEPTPGRTGPTASQPTPGTSPTPTGPGTEAATPTPSGTNAPIPTATPTVAPVRDLAAAKAALARSGYDGQPIPLAYATGRPLNGLDLTVVATSVRAQLARVGIRVTLAPAPVAKALAAYEKGVNAMGLWSWTPEYAEPEAALAFAPGGHLGHRARWVRGVNSALDTLTAATRTSFGDERPGAFARWQLQMQQFGPFVPLFQPAAHVAHGGRVTAVPRTPIGSVDLAGIR
ncbi:ABC transporter substrate-binding protein [Intrasporangium sp. DVR]|uniref:ABC transporter substrate-binding protein n=1 Tax=Intrasporangium sp. DVR TaxID=3127867 RepID=UPI00313A5776